MVRFGACIWEATVVVITVSISAFIPVREKAELLRLHDSASKYILSKGCYTAHHCTFPGGGTGLIMEPFSISTLYHLSLLS